MKALVEDDNVITGTVHRVVAVAVKAKIYRNLADHLKAPIWHAWDRLRRGRTILRTYAGDAVLFVLTLDPSAKQVGSILDEVDLEEALADVGAGAVITDRYELQLAIKLVEKFGQRVR